ncbi:MAG: glycosyltransferase [Gammaproteobacteria bacterium]
MKPSLLFYCQHALGMGHLVRSFALAAALTRHFQVVFLNGGPLPPGFAAPDGVTVIDLPPLGLAEGYALISRDSRYSVEEAQRQRRVQVLAALADCDPRVILIELFPFGRKKFAFELLPLLKAARRQRRPPLIFSSVRDILVGARHDAQRHDDRAAWLANRYFDGVLTHADPRFARLEESFHPARPLTIPVHYTGFVSARRAVAPEQTRARRVWVSSGGGIVGAPLLKAAVRAQRQLWERTGLPMTVVAGPFLPESEWRGLGEVAAGAPGLQLLRSLPDLGAVLGRVALSVSQCGYNTAMDILAARVPALVVPFAEGREDEQMKRARRLEGLGLVRVLEAERLSGETLAEELQALGAFRPQPLVLDLHGADNSARLLSHLMAQARMRAPA